VNIQGNTIHAVAGINYSAISGVGIQVQNCAGYVGPCYVQGNLIYNCGYNAEGVSGFGPHAIFCYYSSGVIIRNNVCHDIYQSQDNAQEGIGVDLLNSTNCQATGNVFYNCQGAGVFVNSTAATANTNVVACNLVVNCSTVNGAGISISGTGAASIYNNTVLQQSGTHPALAIDTTANTVNKGIYNNILVTPAGVTAISLPTSSTGFALQGNAYLSGTGFSATYNSTACTSLASWRTATGQETSPNGFALTANPCLMPTPIPSNITPTNIVAASVYGVTPASGLGTTGLNLSSLYGVTITSTDLLGDSLNATALPVGAVNYFGGTVTKRWFPGLSSRHPRAY
jgi:Right handed beta helix region